ncbi:VCBS repeat-containing protein, partial [bacterium]|nr:VCBS repeat-containing protein [bacterium]
LMPENASFIAFDPTDAENTDPAKTYTIPGVSATEAWKWATGRPDVLVAAVDDGLSTYDQPDLRDRFYLNAGELPKPQIGDATCGDYDCNGDGRFSASDYADDNRVLPEAGGGPIAPNHLIAVFSDGKDDDGNGFVDDISGWDFFRDVNEALGVEDFPEGTHGDGADNIVNQAENGSGGQIGFCPDCTVLPIRVSDAVIADMNLIGLGVQYGHDMGAKIITIALGGINQNDFAHQAILDAYDDGVLTIAASGDELGIHTLWPAAGEDVLNVKSLFPFGPIDLLGPVSIELIAFTEGYCTNYGAHTDIAVPAGAICTSEATNNTTGNAALIVSRARDLGIELSANELKQIITMSADDIYERCVSLVETPAPGVTCQVGWDQHFGYGRLNTKKAFDMLGYPELGLAPAIPPTARITSPKWWRVVDPSATPVIDIEGQMDSRYGSYTWVIEGAAGVQPRANKYVPLASGTTIGPVEGVIASVDISGLLSPALWNSPATRVNEKTVSLRLVVKSTTPEGVEVRGEARKAMQLQQDDDTRTGLIPGLPVEIGASIEASPRLVDIDGDPDGKLEIIFATSLGEVHAFKYDAATGGWADAPGFPVDVSGDDPRFNWSVVGGAAVGDLDGDGTPEIVAATVGGEVYAMHHNGNLNPEGALLPGFPVRVDIPDNDNSFEYGHGKAIVAAPALGDLDNDGLLEIVAGSYNQRVYAWRIADENHDNEADLVSGWPVTLTANDPDVTGNLRCAKDALPGQVLGSPAIGILDPDNADPAVAEHPAVVVPSTEVCENGLLPTGRMFAVYHNGNAHPDGPFLPGWPAKIPMPLGDAIPVPPLTTGATNSPAIYHHPDGTTRISAGGFLWFPQIIVYDGETIELQNLFDDFNMTTSSSGTFSKFAGDDSVQFLLPTLGFLNAVDNEWKLESWNVVAFDVDDTSQRRWRERWEDVQFFINPVTADLDGDWLPEVIAGSGGHMVHAYDIDTNEPEGWPKTTYNWAIASPAVADIDRDGYLEVIQPTHEGLLYGWESRGPACHGEESASDWWTYHHDERGTGTYGTDTRPPATINELYVEDLGGGQFELTFPASGDDGMCGKATAYEVRYTTGDAADLEGLDNYLAAPTADIDDAEIVLGGNTQTLVVDADAGAVAFSVRAVDDEGQVSWPSKAAVVGEDIPGENGSDDDTDRETDDDDAGPYDDAQGPFLDEGDEQGCSCGG